MGFHGAWAPLVMKSFRDDDAQSNFRLVFEYYLFATLMILVVLSLFSEEILLLLTTEEFSDGYVVVPLLILSTVLASIAGYFTYGIQIRKKSQYRLYINLFAVAINCLLNLALIPAYGIIGAGLATCGSYAFLAAAGMMISQRLYHVPYRWFRVFAALIFGTLIASSVIAADLPISLSYGLFKLILTVLGSVILMWVLKINPQSLLNGKLPGFGSESRSG